MASTMDPRRAATLTALAVAFAFAAPVAARPTAVVGAAFVAVYDETGRPVARAEGPSARGAVVAGLRRVAPAPTGAAPAAGPPVFRRVWVGASAGRARASPGVGSRGLA